MGRLHHLQETFVHNLQCNSSFAHVEFVLLNYSSPDSLDRWAQEHILAHVLSGRVVYAKVDGFSNFHPAHAKNICQRLARGAVVCNLDADNFTGDGFAEYLWDYFASAPGNRILHARGNGGTFGRIAMLKSSFIALGGYDERFQQGWGYEDNDLILRAMDSGYRVEPISSGFCEAITHSDSERVQYCFEKDAKKSRRHHRQLSSDSLAQGHFVANKGKLWGTAKLRINFNSSLNI